MPLTYWLIVLSVEIKFLFVNELVVATNAWQLIENVERTTSLRNIAVFQKVGDGRN
jgi:hypothetical protein